MEFVNEPSELSEEAAPYPGDRSSAQMRENDTDPRANNPVPGEPPGTVQNSQSHLQTAWHPLTHRPREYISREIEMSSISGGTVGPYKALGLS